jgi:hypothetical protein
MSDEQADLPFAGLTLFAPYSSLVIRHCSPWSDEWEVKSKQNPLLQD